MGTWNTGETPLLTKENSQKSRVYQVQNALVREAAQERNGSHTSILAALLFPAFILTE